MAVALCSAQFGAGGQTFGTGRDGGREWTYLGSLPMPQLAIEAADSNIKSGDSWSGYTVVQAKHKERLRGGTEDRDWLLNELRKEVNAWLREDRPRHPKPENFLLITNVRLSAVQEVGGIDIVEAAMAEHAKSLGLRGWAVWHSSHVSRLLDQHPGVRQTYLGLVVTGDVLTALLEGLSTSNPDAARALTGFVAKELVANSNIRLTRAGNGPDQERLSDIGIDLPAQDRLSPVDPDGKPINHFVARTIISQGDHPRKVQDGNFCTLLIGGPGQGKSTIGQLICQSYRAAILEARTGELALDQQRIMHDTLTHLREIRVPLPRMHRWPIYVRLTEYSERILGAEDYSLLKFIAEQINNRGGAYSLTQGHLYNWLRQWPWMIVLDGLDEVPDTHTRRTLLQKVSEFLSDAAMQRADISVLVTTRRQGYNDDMRTWEPREFELVELSNQQALHYGRQLVTSRHPADSAFADLVHDRLIEAAKEKMTAKLMGSPLQVSIMASLLEDRVRLPTTRHALFADFYETVFKREANKIGSIGERVEQHKANIDALHNAAGMLLHFDGEKSGQADVHLTRADLQSIATDQLVAQTYENSAARKAAEHLIGLATDRFILLVEKSTDNWGFEVRSFQEFMASRYIVSGPEDQIMDRLRILARSSHWRNTWLFAAAQVFEMRPHLRETLLAIVAEADSQSMSDYLARPGAILAVDMLLDNFAATTPGLQQRLVKQTIEILDAPLLPVEILPIIQEASERDPVVRRLVQERFQAAMRAGGPRRASMLVLMRLWTRRYKGAISTYVRPRLPGTASSAKPDGGGESFESIWGSAGQAARRQSDFNVGEMLADKINWDSLSEDETATLSDFLKEAQRLRVLPQSGGIKGYSVRKVGALTTAKVAKSNGICAVLADACESLSEEETAVAEWLIRQIAQSVRQDFVGDKLSSAGPLPQRASA
ncbi:hypothetical protein GA0061083_2856 [Pseudarthrobacter enclensis]|nr:hypothetical protein GA0061083_2856 [Pseudarthrobacter enclensis]